MLRLAKTLEGYELRARDGAFGRVTDIYFDDAGWHARYFVVDTGVWLAHREVLIAAASITVRDWDQRTLAVDLTKEQIRQSPSIDTAKPVSRQHEEELHHHYAWPYYWTAPMAGGAFITPIGPGFAPTPAAFDTLYPRDESIGKGEQGEVRSEGDEPRQKEKGDPHLRSFEELRGYHLQATDGSIGHVEDLVLEDEAWAVRFFLVDTRHWWRGKKVLVAPTQIRGISWNDRSVAVSLTRLSIQEGPAFDETLPLDLNAVDRRKAEYEDLVRRRGDG